ncbi:MAG: F0F1 ATP synthase subunit gamma [candidate division Zixibacteria bacterium]|nr:F0F1 ATP synthase subunit gamma [candidate division Zixibacteria bacterium]
METLESLRRHLEGAEDLQSVVKTMKAIAAVNIRQYEEAADALQEYSETLSMGFQVLMKQEANLPEALRIKDSKGLGAMIFGSEMGMVGRFNEEIVEYALDKIGGGGNGIPFLMVTGYKVASLLSAEKMDVQATISQPGSVDGIGSATEEVILELYDWWRDNRLATIYLFYNRRVSGASYEPSQMKLLPLDIDWLNQLKRRDWESGSLPQITADWRKVFQGFLRQYFYVSIYRAFAESLASENASRLASMQAAEKNIEEQLQELNTRYNQRRQDSVTSELLDIASGFEALEGEDTE